MRHLCYPEEGKAEDSAAGAAEVALEAKGFPTQEALKVVAASGGKDMQEDGTDLIKDMASGDGGVTLIGETIGLTGGDIDGMATHMAIVIIQAHTIMIAHTTIPTIQLKKLKIKTEQLTLREEITGKFLTPQTAR